MTDLDLSDHRPVPEPTEPTDPGELGASYCHFDGQDWPCDAVRATWPSATTTAPERLPVEAAPHPTWPDGAPMLLGQLVAFAGSEVDEPDVETIEARIVKIDVGEITAWWDEPDGVCEAVLEPDHFRRIDAAEPATAGQTISVDDLFGGDGHRYFDEERIEALRHRLVHGHDLPVEREEALALLWDLINERRPAEPQPDIGWIYDKDAGRLLHPSGFNLTAQSIGSTKPFDDLVRAVLAWPDPS